MSFFEVKTLEKEFKNIKEEVSLIGWVRTNRTSKGIGFISLHDGTCQNTVQIVYKESNIENFDAMHRVRTGAAIYVSGKLVQTPDGKQPFEIQADSIAELKASDDDYPLQKKAHSEEFLREIAHLRPRSNMFQAIMRVRSKMAFAIHEFFNYNDFIWVSSPLITSNDAEGAGEYFVVGTNDKESFFNGFSALTVTGQFQAEAYALAFKKVYTFGPTFRAEKSHTSRHISEFWMIEPEIAFGDLQQTIILAEEMLKSLIRVYLERCPDEIAYFDKEIEPGLIEKLNKLVSSEFAKMPYSQAIEILKDAVYQGHQFEENNIHFGMDLASEHEKYICEVYVKGPVFIYNYPKDIKAFYMYQNDDGQTVAATDLLVPGIGEIIGGSQREDDYDKLLTRMNELNIEVGSLEWYLNMRRYGYYKSSGFGLGFERLLMYLTGVKNIRDVIPFPRTPGSLKF